MNFVQPIRDWEKINKMYVVLRRNSERDFILFLLGVSTGLRISDLLKLKKEIAFEQYISIHEIKTKKAKQFKIPPYIKKYLVPYARTLNDGDYLFKSRNGRNQPIDRSWAYRILNDAAKEVGIRHIGTHTLRKTFGYHFYKNTKDIATLQTLFNHSREDVTLRYIGITQDKLDHAMEKVKMIDDSKLPTTQHKKE
jgi:integrase